MIYNLIQYLLDKNYNVSIISDTLLSGITISQISGKSEADDIMRSLLFNISVVSSDYYQTEILAMQVRNDVHYKINFDLPPVNYKDGSVRLKAVRVSMHCASEPSFEDYINNNNVLFSFLLECKTDNARNI